VVYDLVVDGLIPCAEDFGKLPKTTGSPRRIRPVADWSRRCGMLPRVTLCWMTGWRRVALKSEVSAFKKLVFIRVDSWLVQAR
jgi:hypothetical protein